MKLKDLEKKLKEELKIKRNTFLRFNEKESKDRTEKELKIIGITGSRGKTTVANLLHEYLKLLNFKSVLYSSNRIVSPMSLNDENESAEISFSSLDELYEIIVCAKEYGADYLILEVNESTIKKGITKDIPFDVRVLTNLNPKHNLDNYNENEYVSIKKRFFTDIDDECICVYGLQDYDKKLFNELLNLNNFKKVLFSTRHIASVKEVDERNINVLLTDLINNKEGLDFKVNIDGKNMYFNTKNNIKYNILNYLCVISVLKSLDLFNYNIFNKLIKDIKLKGRLETYKIKGRTIVVDLQLSKILEEYKELRREKKINKLKVVIGSFGTGFITWEERFNDKEKRHNARKYAMNLLNDEVDYVYLTESDNANERVEDICMEMKQYLTKTKSEIIPSRSDAIKKAIIDSTEGDAILILGRGNRKALCNSRTTMKLIKDSEEVEKVLKELNYL